MSKSRQRIPPRQPNMFETAIIALWKPGRWVLLAVGMLLASTAAAYYLGLAIYEHRGEVNSYDQQKELQVKRMFIAQLSTNRYIQGGLGGLIVGMTENSFVRRGGYWQQVAPHKLEREGAAALIFQTNQEEKVTRFCAVFPDLNADLVQSLQTVLFSPGTPDAQAGQLGEFHKVYATNVWRKKELLMTSEVRIDGENRYTVIINVIGANDPRYLTRWETGGLLPVHRHASEIKEQLTTREKE